MDLSSIRSQISDLDARLLSLLREREEAVRQVLEAKDQEGRPLRDSTREEDMLEELIRKGRELGLEGHYVTRIFQEIIDHSLRTQQRLLQDKVNPRGAPVRRVAFQGQEGAYSHLAACKHFASHGEEVSIQGYGTLDEVLEAVSEGAADFGILPVENTFAGSINEVYDLLNRTDLAVVGEEVLEIQSSLVALEDVPLSRIRRIYSHPMALNQCTRFLARMPHVQREYYADTALAMQKIRDDQDLSQAAIGPEEAARIYGLKVLERNISDQAETYTRFLVVAKEPVQVDPRVPARTSLILSVPSRPGSLLKALHVFHDHNVNLTKLESRPKPGSPFDYLFYVDFEGNIASEHIQEMLDQLRSVTGYLKVLGSYPSEMRPRTTPSTRAFLQAGAAEVQVPSNGNGSAAANKTAPKKKPKSYRLASRETKAEDTVIHVQGVEIGGPEFVMMAGPCSVENRDQILACARHVKESGGHVLRGGCFKPRTSPYSFQGLGYEGLELLVEAGRTYGLPVITEVLTTEDVRPVAEYADILQIGARNMQNFSLLKECGKVDRPVMLKRGLSASIEEFLNAAEYILAQGNHQVILCERGIRTFETHTRNTLDLGAIPLLKQMTHLPIVVDPSHAAGKRDLVMPLALAAHAVGPHGMIVEIHPEPEKALSDGPQALLFPMFTDLMRQIYGGQTQPA